MQRALTGRRAWRRRLVRPCIVLVHLLALSGPGSFAVGAEPAPEGSRRTQAEALFREGRQLLGEGKFAEACQRFERSLEFESSPGTLLNLGACYEQRGDLLSALAVFERAAKEAQAEPDAAKRSSWLAAAQERQTALTAALPSLNLTASPTAGARVTIDRRVIEPLSGPISLNPGRHRIEVSAPNHRGYVHELELAGGQRLSFALPALQPDPVVVAPQPAESRPFPVLGWSLAGGGAALLVGGLITGLLANGKAAELDQQCREPDPISGKRACDDPALADTRDSGRALALATDILLGLGLASAGVGATLLVLDAGDEEPARLSAQCQITSRCGLLFEQQF